MDSIFKMFLLNKQTFIHCENESLKLYTAASADVKN